MRFATILLSAVFLLGASGPEPKKEGGSVKKVAASKKGEAPAWPVEITWLNYEDGLKKGKLDNKNIFVDFYTSWCGWCKKLDKEVYSDSAVKVVLARHFVTVKTNAESSRRFVLDDGKEYTDARLAREVFGVQGYPALWFLTSSGEKLTYIPGYIPKDKFVNILTFISSKAYQTKKFEEYEKELAAKKTN
ncbi:MAG: thioredoxin fold domain-containing protein [candidate division Zixibacteria bacterium]|nr:thioredoxin fold domain-containing protein [candidate division Zixibacteria bacterium]